MHAEDDVRAARLLLEFARLRYASAFDTDGDERSARLEQSAEAARLARKLASIVKPPASGGKRELVTADGADDDAEFPPSDRPDVRFDDVAGLAEVKREIDLALIRPLRFPEEARDLGIQPGGGLLLYGPPGNGKTLIARAIAGEVEAPFFSVKPSQIMSQWVGKAEQNIAALFEAARRHPRALIFIDEVEALVPKRAVNQSTVMARVVPQILAEMEGFDEHASALMFIGATNQPWSIDEAVMRPGRLDTKIYVGLPDAEARAEVFRLHLRGRRCADDVDVLELATMTEGRSGADIRKVCERAARNVFEQITRNGRQARLLTMADLVEEAQRTSPSVAPGMLQKFEQFRRET